MEKNIVKNGTKVILFATEDTSVTLVNYGCHHKELDLDNLMRKDFEVDHNNGTSIRLLTSSATFAVFYGEA